jgi:carboxyl-terminal processing protease
LSKLEGYQSLVSHLNNLPIVEEFMEFAKAKGLEQNNIISNEAYKVLKRSLYSNIIYQLQGMLEHIKYINLEDPTVLKAIEVLEKGESFP